MKFTETESRMVVSRVVMVGMGVGEGEAGMISYLMDLEFQFCKRKGVLEIG